MFRHKVFVVTTLLAVLVSSLVWVGTSMATPGSGVTPSPITAARLADPVQLKFKTEGSGFGNGLEVTNLSMVKFTVVPGGAFGWHQHGGPVWAIIASGTLTLYQGDDPSCQGKEYGPGSALLDPGDHTHNARNESDVDVVVYATFMLPEGGAARIDVPSPGNCPF